MYLINYQLVIISYLFSLVVYFSSMVGIVSQLKEIILNHTLKSYKITPIESANVLRVTMKFYGSFKYKSPSKRRRDKLRKEKFPAKFRRAPILVPICFLEPGQSPSPAILGGPVQNPSSLPFPQRWRSWWLKPRRCIRSLSTWPRRQRMLKSKGTECVIGYWT